MNDKKWEKFFELMAEVIELPGLSANEKAAKVHEEAKAQGEWATGALEEFMAWDIPFDEVM